MKLLTSSVLALGLIGSSFADTIIDFGRPNLAPQQVATIESNTTFEDFVGRTNKVSGTLKIDLKKKTGSGKIIVDLASVNTGIDARDEHMRSEGWLNVAKYPTATFETTSVKSKGGDKFDVTGKFTLHGVTKTIKVPATVKYVAESELTKKNRFNGDVVQLKTKFNIKLSDYGIMVPAMAKDKVANEVTIGLSVVGTSKA